MLKLYVVVRNDIDVPFQMCQVAHAVAGLATEHINEFVEWNLGNNTICVLQTPNGRTLAKLVETAVDGDFKHTTFYEPDAGSVGRECYYDKNAHDVRWRGPSEEGPWLTAVAFAPNWTVQNVLLADLPLALNEKAVREKVGLGTNSMIVDGNQLNLLKQSYAQLSKLERGSRRDRRRYFKSPRTEN